MFIITILQNIIFLYLYFLFGKKKKSTKINNKNRTKNYEVTNKLIWLI